MTNVLRDFLEIPYDQLEELNLEAKAQRLARKSPAALQEERLRYLADEKRIKAVTVLFSKAGCICSTMIRSSCSSRPIT